MSQVLPVLLFDGDCAFCTSCVGWMRRHIGRLDATEPYQFADLAALGVTAEQCEQAVQYISADGAVVGAHLAIAKVLVDAGKGWRVLGRLIAAPGLRAVSAVLYRWVSRNRHRLPGGMPACAMPTRQGDAVR